MTTLKFPYNVLLNPHDSNDAPAPPATLYGTCPIRGALVFVYDSFFIVMLMTDKHKFTWYL